MRYFLPSACTLCLGVAIYAAAASMPASHPAPPDQLKNFPAIRRQLASPDFAQREDGQKLLDAIPPSQLDALRALAREEADPEVKTRLESRIGTIELDLVIHPLTVSLDVTDATIAKFCHQLNIQLGEDLLHDGGGKGPNFTLKVDNLPLWDVILQLQRQSPFSLRNSMINTPAGLRSAIYFSRTDKPPASYLVDNVLVTPEYSDRSLIMGERTTAAWGFRLSCIADPRLRLTQHSTILNVTKITDQDGNNLLPAVVYPVNDPMNNLVRPMAFWTSNVSLNATPGVTAIKELRGTIDIAFLEKESTVTIDLTKPVDPIETTRGTLTVAKDPTGKITMRFSMPDTEPDPQPARLPLRYTAIRLYKGISIIDTNVHQGRPDATITISPNAVTTTATKLELSWADTSRLYPLPVVLHNLPVPKK